jgi:transposase InsO family protein
MTEVRTEKGKLHLFVAIDRTSKFAFAELHEKATRRVADDFLRRLPAAAVPDPHRSHGPRHALHGADRRRLEAADIRRMRAAGEWFRCHSFEFACAELEIEHRLTKPNHPWTNGQVERMNRTLKEATVRRYHYDTHDALRAHNGTFLDA